MLGYILAQVKVDGNRSTVKPSTLKNHTFKECTKLAQNWEKLCNLVCKLTEHKLWAQRLFRR